MKQSIVFVAVLFGILGSANAQFRAGSVEITLLGGGGSVSSSVDRSGSSSSSDNSEMFITLSAMPSYFIVDGLSIEPEVQVYIESPKGSSSHSAVGLTGCLSYTFLTGSSAFPFLRAGYGIAGGVQFPIFGGMLFPALSDNASNVTGPYIGGGVKFLVSPSVAVRLELGWRGQYYSIGDAPYTSDYSYSTVALRFGLSLLTGTSDDTAKH
jgi:opacity protein-like surface antigen